MKVVTESVPEFVLVPREYPLISDTLDLVFENGFIIPFDLELSGSLLKITLNDTSQFKQRDNYSFTLLNGTKIIYKGRIIFLKDGTDVQNYTNQSQDNKRWK